ncbi:MAG TPA: O-antigen ligase family protein [Candidatus Cybelea sp.]|nr:O-antigen ligase family protein [Candidatus Cybelea sp.]
MRRLMPAALGLVYAMVPLFPSFIALTNVAFPGVSLVPRAAVLAVFAVCGLLAIYAAAMLLRYPSRGSQPLLLPLLAVVGAGILAGLVGFDPRAGLLFTFIGGLGVVWHCSIVRFYDDRYAAVTLLGAYLASGAVAGAVAIGMVVRRVPASEYAIQHGRATGTFILPGELAGYLIVLLPIAYAVGRVAQPRWLRATAWAALSLGLVALALTYSRAGWMGFAAAVAFLVAAQTRYGARAAAIVVVAGALVVLLLFNVHHNPSEDYTRLSIWQAALQIIDRFPLTGVGPFNFSRLYALVRAPDADPTAFHAHSLYLTFFAEFGVIGVASVVWLLWRFTVELRRRLSDAAAPAKFLALSVTAGLVGVAVQGLIDTVTVVIFGLWMATLGLALAAAGRKRSDVAP